MSVAIAVKIMRIKAQAFAGKVLPRGFPDALRFSSER